MASRASDCCISGRMTKPSERRRSRFSEPGCPQPGKIFARAIYGLFVAFAFARALASSAAPAPTDAEKAQFFKEHVKPLLDANCIKCHGGDKTKGGLKLTSRQSIVKGGDTGPAISTDQPDKSLLLKAISYADPDLQMPPKKRLNAEQVAVLTKWVQMGAPWSGSAAPEPTTATEAAPKKMAPPVNAETMKFWSFQPVKRPLVPAVKHADWVKTAIDAFILAKLEADGLDPAPAAPKAALLRRAYYDLTGLPPTPAEVEAFLKDESPNAFETVVDRLLASPRYGERWARHWLDVVRFAETNSFERDGLKPNAWRYRDYVIDAFNNDKPYDQFVREQIAGDELDHVTAESVIATGYYRLGIWDDEPADRAQARMDEFDDVVATTGQAFLGLTVNCARCHDHKLDPIPQKDYYRLLAFFRGIRPNGTAPEDVLTEIAPDDELQAVQDEAKAVSRRKTDVLKQIADIERPVIDKLPEAQRTALPHGGPRRRAALDPILKNALGEDPFRHYEDLQKELATLQAHKAATAYALSIKELGPNPEPTFIMIRGNAHVPGDQVEPGFPSVLNPPAPVIPAPNPGATTSGRRRALADWLASDRNPLAARVMINRVWQHHFGRGIVRSPNDFGNIGDRPTHPELLDWLASEFVARGWKLKQMHRLIVLSSAYQMSSTANPAALAKDPQNDLFWRFDMRRLEAEEVRDSILAVNGTLNLTMHGPGVFPTIPKAVLAGQSRPGDGWGQSAPQEQARRSIYIHQKRSLVVPILASLDVPDGDSSCPARFTTTQSTQALGMMNSDFVNEEAKVLAARLRKEGGDQPADQVKLALRLALCHEPAQPDVDRGVRFMAGLEQDLKVPPDIALNQFCLLVLNLNEFVYLD
jgi:mono/diheme cytochrome c family protein